MLLTSFTARALVSLAVLTSTLLAAGASARPQYAGSRVVHPDRAGRFAKWDAADDGSRRGMYIATTMQTSGDKTITINTLEYAILRRDDTFARSAIASWTSEEKEPTRWVALDSRVMPNGDCFSVVERTGPLSAGAPAELIVYEGAQARGVVFSGGVSAARILMSANGPIVVAKRGNTLFEIVGGKTKVILRSTDYDWSVAMDDDGRIYVVAYDSGSRSLVLATRTEVRGASRPSTGESRAGNTR